MSKVIRISKRTEEYLKDYKDTLLKEIKAEKQGLYTIYDYFQKDDNVIADALKTAKIHITKKK